jgi:hypothetical protein
MSMLLGSSLGKFLFILLSLMKLVKLKLAITFQHFNPIQLYAKCALLEMTNNVCILFYYIT